MSAPVQGQASGAGEAPKSADAILWAVDAAIVLYIVLDVVAQILPPTTTL